MSAEADIREQVIAREAYSRGRRDAVRLLAQALGTAAETYRADAVQVLLAEAEKTNYREGYTMPPGVEWSAATMNDHVPIRLGLTLLDEEMQRAAANAQRDVQDLLTEGTHS